MMDMPMMRGMMGKRMNFYPTCGCHCYEHSWHGGHHLLSKEERKRFLQEYKEELEAEIKGVEEEEKGLA